MLFLARIAVVGYQVQQALSVAGLAGPCDVGLGAATSLQANAQTVTLPVVVA